MTFVIKRDKTKMQFDSERIFNAVFLAASDANYSFVEASQIAQDTAVSITASLTNIKTVEIDEVTKVIENTLMSSCWKAVARKFIEYRHDRDQARELKSNLHKNIIGLVDQSNKDILNENANKPAEMFHVQRDLLAGIISKHYALKYLLPRDVANSHLKGEIHFHDMDYAPLLGMTNCSLVDVKGMLARGFKMGNAHVETPKSLLTAATVISQIICGTANLQFGGVSVDRIDEILEPYVTMTYEKEKVKALELFEGLTKRSTLTEEELDVVLDAAMSATKKAAVDATQSLEFQINTLYSSQG